MLLPNQTSGDSIGAEMRLYILVHLDLLALNAHFCYSPMSVNRKYADMLAVEKQDMIEEESSHADLQLSLIKIREHPQPAQQTYHHIEIILLSFIAGASKCYN